jgi:hypothetical protein
MDKSIFTKDEIDGITGEDHRRLDALSDLLKAAQAEFAGWREFERDPVFDAPIERAREALRAEEDRVVALCQTVRQRQHDIREQIERTESVITLSAEEETRATQLAPLIERTCRTEGYRGRSVYLTAALTQCDKAQAGLYYRFIRERLASDEGNPQARTDNRDRDGLVAVVDRASGSLRTREHSRAWNTAMALIERSVVMEQYALRRRRADGELFPTFAANMPLVPRVSEYG